MYVFSWGCEGISSFKKHKKKVCKNFLSSALLFVLIIKLILKWKNVFDDTMMSIYAFAVEF